MSPARRRSVAGARIVAVTRRGKHQFIELDDGRKLHAHFRMTGDWKAGKAAATARYPRATIALGDGSVVVLDDPRALSSIELVAAGVDPVPDIGPDADDPSIGLEWLAERLGVRRVAIKVALLDQGLVSGIGNIYASEALWRARIDPRRESRSLTPGEVGKLLTAIRAVLKRASGARYTESNGRFDVYDRDRKRCRRCRTPIQRISQAGRSTYWCAVCQV